jgi:hypothetical protein
VDRTLTDLSPALRRGPGLDGLVRECRSGGARNSFEEFCGLAAHHLHPQENLGRHGARLHTERHGLPLQRIDLGLRSAMR